MLLYIMKKYKMLLLIILLMLLFIMISNKCYIETYENYNEKKVIEFVPIILWKNDKGLYDIIKNEFNIVDTFSFTFNENNLRKKLEELYYPHKISIDDSRIKSKNIKILILEMKDPIYKIGSRNEHKNKPLNQTIIEFKENTRKKYNFTFFHSADFLNESQHTYKIFDIKKYITNELFINIDDLRGVIWLNKISDKYCLKNITETPHYLYLNDQKEYYEKYVTEIDNLHSTNIYNSLITSINSDKININNITISVSYHTDINKYVILDGFHRSCIYLNNNINYIKCRLTNQNQFLNLKNRYAHEHYFDFEKTMIELEKNNVRYVIIRGFNKLPITPDTDLDIVCHPEDLDKVKDIMLKELHLMNSKIIQIGLEKVNYVQFKTKNIPNNLIKNTYFHIDIYDNIFFFYEKKICMSKLLHKLFDNRIKYMMKFYIPTPEFEYFLLLIRICFDLGFLKDKHKYRLIELIPDVKNENNLFNYLNDMEKTHLLLKINDLSIPIVKSYPNI